MGVDAVCYLGGGPPQAPQAQRVRAGGDFPTLAGTPLKVDIQGEKIMVGSATALKADIACSNGVIHVIDSVLLPVTPVEPKMLVGKWTYTSAVKSGEKKTAEQLEGQSVEITPKTWTLNGEATPAVCWRCVKRRVRPLACASSSPCE